MIDLGEMATELPNEAEAHSFIYRRYFKPQEIHNIYILTCSYIYIKISLVGNLSAREYHSRNIECTLVNSLAVISTVQRFQKIKKSLIISEVMQLIAVLFIFI
jgi:hypothetical protein